MHSIILHSYSYSFVNVHIFYYDMIDMAFEFLSFHLCYLCRIHVSSCAVCTLLTKTDVNMITRNISFLTQDPWWVNPVILSLLCLFWLSWSLFSPLPGISRVVITEMTSTWRKPLSQPFMFALSQNILTQASSCVTDFTGYHRTRCVFSLLLCLSLEPVHCISNKNKQQKQKGQKNKDE